MREVVRSAGLRAASGPFAGLRYPEPAPKDWYYPQILGTYEKELAPVTERWLRLGEAKSLIVAGAAEGYFAVGLARSRRFSRIFAFEVAARPRQRLAETAKLNAVELEIAGLCDFGALKTTLASAGQAFLLADIEGGEALLLDPQVVPRLATTEMLVEVHDFVIPCAGETLMQRFSRTHHVRRFDPLPRTRSDFPALSLRWWRALEARYLSLMDEGRPPGCYWLHFVPVGSAPP